MKNDLWRNLAFTVVMVLSCFEWEAGAQQGIDFDKIELQTVKVADGLYVLVGGANQGNIAVSVGSDGILLVDSMFAQMHDKIMAALAKISSQPVRYVISTHLHGDHTSGNALMAKQGAVIIAHENVRKRMALLQNNPPPAAALPVTTYTESMTLHFNGEEIYIYHPAPAHTDGDSVVFFRHANAIHVGDLPASLRYPNIGVMDGGSANGMISAAEQVIKLSNSDTKIISGHIGPIAPQGEVRQQIDFIATVRDRVANAIRDGKTLEQVLASKPTAGFDKERMGGNITAERFVGLVYADLSRKPQ